MVWTHRLWKFCVLGFVPTEFLFGFSAFTSCKLLYCASFASFHFFTSSVRCSFLSCKSLISALQECNCFSRSVICWSWFWHVWSSRFNSFFISVWESKSFSSSVIRFSASLLFLRISSKSDSICCNSRSFSLAFRQSLLVFSTSFNKLSFSWL